MRKKSIIVFLIIIAVVVVNQTFVVLGRSDNRSSRNYYQVVTEDYFQFLPLVVAQIQATVNPTPTSTTPPGPTQTPIPPGVIVVNSQSVDLFDQIPNEYINAAADLDMMFVDRSVGQNINEGLDCLSYSSNVVAPSACRRSHSNPLYDLPIETWDRSYDRSNWSFHFWDEAVGCTTWSEKVGCFFTIADRMINQKDVLSFQFSYLSVDSNSTIADLPGGFFWNSSNLIDVYDHEAYEAQHPNKIFIYWTTSLARTIGTDVSNSFNNQMRQYAISNNKILFDVADILSHLPDGTPCYDNVDGQNLAICPHYTTELYGGHLGSVSKGKIMVAKAYWVLMAQIAGWDPTVR